MRILYILFYCLLFSCGITKVSTYSDIYNVPNREFNEYDVNFDLNYSDENASSYLNLLVNNYENKTNYSYLFGFISYFAFLLNRAEVWGLFFSRYNPTFTEFIVGSGPLNFGQFYGEIQVSETKSFLLPHSSFLSLLIFIGIMGCMLLALFFIFTLLKNKKRMGSMNYILVGYIILNLVKNDTVNYFPSFITY